MSRWHRQLLAYSYCWVFLSFASVDGFALSCPLWRELLGKSKLRAMRTVLSLSWEEERWKCFKDHYSGAGKLLLGLKPLWMIAGATGFKIWMEKNRWVDWHLCTEWLAGKRDGWKYWFCLFSTASELIVQPQVFRVLWQVMVAISWPPCLINSPYHLPRAHNDRFLGSTVTARSRVGIKSAYCRLLWKSTWATHCVRKN